MEKPKGDEATTRPKNRPEKTDMILAINDPYMQQIIDGEKTYEFRKYNMHGIERIWFYRTAPHSAITHICEVEPARTRNFLKKNIRNNDDDNDNDNNDKGGGSGGGGDGRGDGDGDEPLPEDGIGNKEFNEGHVDWEGYDYAYRVKSVYWIREEGGLSWAKMRDEHGMKMVPRGRVSVPESIAKLFKPEDQIKIR